MTYLQRFLIYILTTLTAFIGSTGPKLVKENGMKIQDGIRYQKMVSWGTSGAWWAQQMSGDVAPDEVARLLFSDDELGLNVYRFNIGAGEKDNPNSRVAIENRKTESFYYYNKETDRYEYDFTRDSSSVKMMDKALAAGADSIIMFCNSPHYSMTVSGQASGGTEPYESNLPKENYQAFVDYVLTIADHFVEAGYPVKYISPINEPQWAWGGEWVGQEGCHYSPEEAVELLELFAVNMKQRHTPYGLMGIESGQLTPDHYAYIDLFAQSKILTSYCDTYCAHSYWMDHLTEAKQEAGIRIAGSMPGLDFDMSEWCELPCTIPADDVESALKTATVIAEDLRYLNANSWSSWTACQVSDDIGSVEMTDRYFVVSSDCKEVRTVKRFYAYKQFSHFIPSGSVRVNVAEGTALEDVIAVAYKRPDCKTVLVIVNNSENDYNISLCGYLKADIYTTDAEKNCENTFSGKFSGQLDICAKSINTVVLSRF